MNTTKTTITAANATMQEVAAKYKEFSNKWMSAMIGNCGGQWHPKTDSYYRIAAVYQRERDYRTDGEMVPSCD